ncbi:right-handed parallel beta-helix repeat-containing protein [Solitalea lacus]|uniref:right-handed parallel beta-helix repeat-containing protein n=1 Tax=Solitalea lacus TaxID=2911172 RepID=UPI001EDAD846|nr:right-handed parallel beta-helix repeat-containing protein [Solitalea lacus]UKJ07224.1 right-handed parallel beta-helix repeat-containing protein [Solitalea lacus]
MRKIFFKLNQNNQKTTVLSLLIAFSFTSLISCKQDEAITPKDDVAIVTPGDTIISGIPPATPVPTPPPSTTEPTTPPSSGSYNYLVSTYDQLKSALSKATSGQVVYVADNAEINMTDKGTLTVPAGVTLKSGRGKTSSTLGGLIYTTNIAHGIMLKAGGTGVKFIGLRVRGASTGTSGSSTYCRGIYSNYSNLEVDNCEIYGWNHAGIYLADGAYNSYIHHSYFHHNQQNGLGYGVSMSKATAKIMYNYFDYNRHAVAGSGIAGSGYEAAYNVVLSHATAHSFDMHGYGGDGSQYVAGDYVKIHDNIFFMTAYRAITVRGTPTQGVYISNNKFAHKSEASALNIFSSSSKVFIGTGNTYNTSIATVNPGPSSM